MRIQKMKNDYFCTIYKRKFPCSIIIVITNCSSKKLKFSAISLFSSQLKGE